MREIIYKDGDMVRRVIVSAEPKKYGEVGHVYKILHASSRGISIIDEYYADVDGFELIPSSEVKLDEDLFEI